MINEQIHAFKPFFKWSTIEWTLSPRKQWMQMCCSVDFFNVSSFSMIDLLKGKIWNSNRNVYSAVKSHFKPSLFITFVFIATYSFYELSKSTRTFSNDDLLKFHHNAKINLQRVLHSEFFISREKMILINFSQVTLRHITTKLWF